MCCIYVCIPSLHVCMCVYCVCICTMCVHLYLCACLCRVIRHAWSQLCTLANLADVIDAAPLRQHRLCPVPGFSCCLAHSGYLQEPLHFNLRHHLCPRPWALHQDLSSASVPQQCLQKGELPGCLMGSGPSEPLQWEEQPSRFELVQ